MKLVAGALALMMSVQGIDAQAQSLSFDQCRAVGSDPQQPYQQASLRFVRMLMKRDAAAMHLQFTPEMRRTTTAEQISTGMLQPLAKIISGLGEPRIAHSFLVTSQGIGGADHKAWCTMAKGSSPALGDKVLVAAKAVPEQAHVIVEADVDRSTMAFVLWLLPEASDWLVAGFHAGATIALSKTPIDFQAMARQQRDRGNLFNAAMLFAEAATLGFRGNYLQLGFWPGLQKEQSALELPPELKGRLPFTWRFEGETFRILNVRPLALTSQLAVVILREVSSLADTTAVDDESRRLIAGFMKKYPEVRDVFDGIVVQAKEPGRATVFGTTETFRK